MKAKMTLIVPVYIWEGETSKRVDAKKNFVCRNFDDLQNLFSTLYDASEVGSKLLLEVDKEEE